MHDDLLKEIQTKVQQLSEVSGIPVQDILLKIQQNIHMDKLRKVLLDGNVTCQTQSKQGVCDE